MIYDVLATLLRERYKVTGSVLIARGDRQRSRPLTFNLKAEKISSGVRFFNLEANLRKGKGDDCLRHNYHNFISNKCRVLSLTLEPGMFLKGGQSRK